MAVAANGLWWARGIPINGAPDEADHYALVHSVAEHGTLPRYGEGEFVVSLMGRAHQRIADANDRRGINRLVVVPEPVELRIPYVFVPQLPYLLNGWICKLLGGASFPVARFVNTLWIALAALLVFLAARAAWPARTLAAWTAGACFALWPQVTFVGAYVNDDAFAIFAAAGFVSACLWCQAGAFTRGRAVGLGGAAGLLFASKPYVLVLVPLGVVWLWFWRRGRMLAGTGPGTAFRRHVGIAAAAALLVCAPGWIRNAALYGGDPTGQTFMRARVREFVESLPAGVLAPHKALFLKPAARRPTTADFTGRWLRESVTSFWARFGWMNVRPPGVYVAAGLWLVALALLAAYAGSRGRALAASPGLFALPGFGLLLAASVWNSYAMDFQPQGRYLLACVPAVMLQINSGIASLRSAAATRVLAALLLGFFLIENVLLRMRVLH